jgi:hypothetical protein
LAKSKERSPSLRRALQIRRFAWRIQQVSAALRVGGRFPPTNPAHVQHVFEIVSYACRRLSKGARSPGFLNCVAWCRSAALSSSVSAARIFNEKQISHRTCEIALFRMSTREASRCVHGRARPRPSPPI